MTDWVAFAGRIEPVVMGKATYTILRLPPEIAATLTAQGASRVEGEIDDHPANLALSRIPMIEGEFLWTGKSLLDRSGLKPGATVEVRLRPAPDDAVDLPDDLARALHDADATDPWARLSPGKRRAALYLLSTAKSEATRAKRVARLIDTLKETP